jgi:iron(III) transport system permease protein
MHDFAGRRWLEWALMLPLAVPVYVMAFSQLGLFDYTGPIQTGLREWTGVNVQVFFQLRSVVGVSLVMSLAFYPYVYLLARNAFKTMGQRALEVGLSLGYSPRRAFWRVALPMARPWLFAGVMLVVMETLADFGAVSIFNFDTLTSGIYKAWFSLFSLPTAQQLAAILLLVVLLVVGLEQYWRGSRRYAAVGGASKNRRVVLKGWAAWCASLWAGLVFTLAFVLPVGQLVVWALPSLSVDLNADFFVFVRGSLGLSVMASVSVVMVALCLSVAKRRTHAALAAPLQTLSTMGYAVPGTVLAVGVFIPVAWLDNVLLEYVWPNAANGAILKGSLWVMMWAYVVRFLAVGYSSVDASMQRVTVNQERAARSLGVSGLALVRRLYLPLMRGGLLTALMMVFVDVMKEMPITLMTRPFGWDTLSVRIFSLTTEGLWREAALPALALIVAGLLPVLYLARQDEV